MRCVAACAANGSVAPRARSAPPIRGCCHEALGWVACAQTNLADNTGWPLRFLIQRAWEALLMKPAFHLIRVFACAVCLLLSGAAMAEPTPGARLVQEAREILDAHYGSRMQLHRAASLLNQALAGNPDDADAYVQAARLTIKGGSVRSLRSTPDSREAYGELLDRALALNPNHAKARILKAEYFYLMGDREAERAELDKALRIGTNDAWLQVGYARHHRRMRDRDEALRLYNEVRAKGAQADRAQNNAYMDALNGVASLLSGSGDEKTLREVIGEMRAARDPRHAWAASEMAQSLVFAGMFEEAVAVARESLLAMDHEIARMALVAALYGHAAELISASRHDQAAVLVAEASSYGVVRDDVLQYYNYRIPRVAKLRSKLELLVR